MNQQGIIALLLGIVAMFAASLLSLSAVFVFLNRAQASKNTVYSYESIYAAESGLEDALFRVGSDKIWSSPYTLQVGNASAEVTISSIIGGIRTITSEGESSDRIRKIEAKYKIASTGIGFFYGVQVGEGGVTMDNNSRIEGSGGASGNFYSNGEIVGTSGSTITGDATVATGISLSTEFTTCNADEIVGQADPKIDFAQSFVAADSKQLSKVSLYLKKVGSPGNRTVYITNNVSGSPGNTSIASGALDESLVTTSYGWIDIVFSSPATLIAGNTYWIVIDAAKNASKYWVWCKDSAAGYSNGSPKYSKDWDDDPWSSATGDLNFKTYLGTGISSIDGLVVYGTVKANQITNSNICGDAYYQSTSTIDAVSKSFLDSPTNPTCGGNPLTPGTGYPNQPDPPISPMPISDAVIDGWKADAALGGTIIGDYNVTSNVSLGPKEITGNLNMTSNNKTLTITGTIYVRGNIDIDNGSTAKCDPSYGLLSCILIADGWIHIKNNSTFSGSGQAGSYIMILTTLQGCNGVPAVGCTHHDAAVDLHNNASGAIFYSTDSMVSLHNGVNVSEVTAYRFHLGENAIVTYESGLLNAEFSSGPSAGWEVLSWKEVP